jgi:hypothetical protein
MDVLGMGVCMQGEPFAPSNNIGPTDTMVQRTGSLPSGGTGDIPIELVALSLQSCAPITVDLGGGPAQWDVHLLINPSGLANQPPTVLPPSQGKMTIQIHNDAQGGGTFDSVLNVIPLLTFRRVDNPLVTVVQPYQVILVATGCMWSHTPGPGDPNNPSYPSGGFYPTGPCQYSDGGLSNLLFSPVSDGPEPAAWVMLVSGFAGIAGMRLWRGGRGQGAGQARR